MTGRAPSRRRRRYRSEEGKAIPTVLSRRIALNPRPTLSPANLSSALATCHCSPNLHGAKTRAESDQVLLLIVQGEVGIRRDSDWAGGWS
jgi:hypothetical protein